MTSVLNLILLACAPIAVVYLAWRWQFPKSATSDERHQAAKGQGEQAMPNVMETDAARVIRWIKDSPNVFESVRRILHEYSQVKKAVGAAQEERGRLQREREELREEVRRLRAKAQHVDKERVESAQWLATVMSEAASRFDIQHPSA